VPGFYEVWLASPKFGPNWMHDPVGNAYWGTVGKILDEQIGRMKLALRCHLPMEALAGGMDDALDEIGKDRLLPRGGTTPGASDEPSETYAARLVSAWDTWALAGSPRGLLLALKAAGFPVEPTGSDYWTTGAFLINHLGIIYQLVSGAITVVGVAAPCINRQRLDGTVPGNLAGFTLDARDQFFSHFALIFNESVSGLDNTPGNHAKACLNQTVARWRCGGSIYAGAAVVPTEAKVWGWPIAPTIKWGDTGLQWGTNGAQFIDPE
jgi:hypothetical protein